MDLEEEYDPSYNDEDEDEITQEDAWAVISAYFEEKGLVRQQLDSFNEFIQNTMQEIVDESADIEIRPESQHNPGHQADLAEAENYWSPYQLQQVQVGPRAVLWRLLIHKLCSSNNELYSPSQALVRTHMVWKKDKKRIRRVRCTCYFPSHCRHS
ncbi:DNA-directed RNA polymerase II subunit RPB2-like isoform X2 [Camellia sinensis]|uniref:DNA-directed RNA polymerase II subunit RPB2-like isoform X2 n=1 Tax=Camellia sinensis TaxID=4442 RepID=UPI001036C07E|nr:DNA-directed RNA polymerase II subunit RPB2-like isoform X2 [Camellia sinensis]